MGKKANLIMLILLVLVPASILGIYSYQQYAKGMQDRMREMNESNIIRNGRELDRIITNINNTSLSFYQSEVVRQYLMTKREETDAVISLDRMMLSKLAYDKEISGVAFRRFDGKSYISGVQFPHISKKMEEEALSHQGKAVFVLNQPKDYSRQADCYGYMRTIYDINDPGVPIGTVELYIDRKLIDSILETAVSDSDDMMGVVSDNRILISSDKRLEGSFLDEFNVKKSDLISSYPLSYGGWTLIGKLSGGAQVQKKQMALMTLLLIIMISASISVGAGYVLSGYIRRGIEKDAMLRSLQAYINPHFLYNTLDTIRWMSKMEQAEETGRLTEALSELLRLTTKDTKKVAAVEDELAHIRSYLLIQECRYADRIDFHLEVDDSLLFCQTVRFALQPIVENAITHGIEPDGGSGEIRITVKREEGDLVFIVENNGRNADIDELNRLLHSNKVDKRGLGISNVNDRIRLLYGADYGLSFKEHKGSGLKVVIRQPIKEAHTWSEYL